MNSDPAQEQEISQINMTPFVDIVLVLLIVFMATASFLTEQALELNLPQALDATPLSEQDPHITLNVDARGQIYFDDEPVTLTELAQRLDQRQPDRPIRLRSDIEARYGVVMEVINLCKANGFFTFALETREDE